MTENCRNATTMMQSNATFNLEHHRFLPIFRRILPGLEATFRTVTFELSPASCCLHVRSSDWNSFSESKKLVENIKRVTIEAKRSSGYEEMVNEEMGKVKVPKKHLLGTLRTVFIDCNNVAIAHGHGRFSWSGVIIVCEYFESLGHSVVMIVPTYRKKQVTNDEEKVFVEEREKTGHLKCVASQSPDRRKPFDDGFLLLSCDKLDGVLISNDRFQDFTDDEKLNNIIQNRLIPYIFIQDRFITGAETFSKKKIDYERLLVKSSPYQQECERMGSQPCPYGEKCNYGKKCKYLHDSPPESRGARYRRFNRTLGPKQKTDNVGTYLGDSSSSCGQSSRDSSRCAPRFSQQYNRAQDPAPNNVFFTTSYRNNESTKIPFAHQNRRYERSTNSDSALMFRREVNERNDEPARGSDTRSLRDMPGFDDRQFELECFSPPQRPQPQPTETATYNMWSGPNFELSPSKATSSVDPQLRSSNWGGAQESTPAGREHFSYFSDSGSSCDDYAISSYSASPVNAICAADPPFLLENNPTGAVDEENNVDFNLQQKTIGTFEKTQGTHAKPAKNCEAVTFDAVFQNTGENFQMNWNEPRNISETSGDVNYAAGPARNWAEKSRKVEEDIESNINSKLEDYNSVIQVLDTSKQVYVLAVMKRHPEFSRADVVMHVLEIVGRGEEKECCSHFIKEAAAFIPSCYKATGIKNDSDLARAFFAVQEKNRESRGASLWREVVRMALDYEPDHRI